MNVGETKEFVKAQSLVLWWVGVYTRGLSGDLANSRREELVADIHDQGAHASTVGMSGRRAARALIMRALRGAPDDLVWRSTSLRSAGQSRQVVLFAVSLAGAALLVLFGAVASIRGLQLHPGSYEVTEPPALLAATGAAACALLMLMRSRTRFIGALWLVGASQILILQGLALLAKTSTVLTWARLSEPVLSGCAVAASVGVGIIYIAVAIAWAPIQVGAAEHS